MQYSIRKNGTIENLKLDNTEIFFLSQERGGIPILFPNAGELQNPKFPNLKRHGFARDRENWQKEKTDIGFSEKLIYDEKSLEIFPFKFELKIEGKFLANNEIEIVESVKNLESEINMPIAFGLHPYFKVENSLKGKIKFNFAGGEIVEEQINKWANGEFITIDNPLTPMEIIIPNFGTLVLEASKEYKKIFIWSEKGKDFFCVEPVLRNAGGIVDDPELVEPHQTYSANFKIKFEKEKKYQELAGKVIDAGHDFSHIMALHLNPKTNFRDGVIRCIEERMGDVAVAGFVDKSILHKVSGENLENFKISERLKFKNQEEVIEKLKKENPNLTFLGFEDPDIWYDEVYDLVHLYFTIPFISLVDEHKTKIHLGHAIGKDLDTLELTYPVLLADGIGGAKELSIAPKNKNGERLNLVESSCVEDDFTYSVVRIAEVENMSEDWKFGNIIFHPKFANIPWIGGHASPGPLFPESFINVGAGKILGIMNGREANKIIDGQIQYGIFSVGLFIYDYENGKIDWVSSQPLIVDSEARTITFASQFIETKKGEGILFAHVDDSFVRAYALKAEDIQKLI